MPGSKETKKQASTAKHTAKQAKETNKNLCKSATAIAASSFKLWSALFFLTWNITCGFWLLHSLVNCFIDKIFSHRMWLIFQWIKVWIDFLVWNITFKKSIQKTKVFSPVLWTCRWRSTWQPSWFPGGLSEYYLNINLILLYLVVSIVFIVVIVTNFSPGFGGCCFRFLEFAGTFRYKCSSRSTCIVWFE